MIKILYQKEENATMTDGKEENATMTDSFEWEEVTTEIVEEPKEETNTEGKDLSLFYGIGGVVLGFLLGFCIAVKRKRDKAKTTIKNSSKTQGITEEIYDVADRDNENNYVVGKLHNIGKRSGQQDSFAVSDESANELIAIVADGMGGLSDGDKISSMVTLSLFKDFHENQISGNESDALLYMVGTANREVNNYLGNDITKCGSTLVAAIINGNKCHWISVGDSHIYLYRRGTLLQLNREHVHREDLDAMVVNGEISLDEAKSTSNKGALTSYIGMGRLEKVDRCIAPVMLKSGDRLLLMTDGVFGTLNDGKIIEAMSYPVEESVKILDDSIQMINKKNQDNYTAVIIEYR